MKCFLFSRILLLLLLGSCSNNPGSTEDVLPPVPGNSGYIGISAVSYSSLNVSWTPAKDDVTGQLYLEYLLWYSTNNNLSSVAACESNGIPVGTWTSLMTNISVNGLREGTGYCFNVMVRDEAGNQVVYTPAVTNTIDDLTAPTPGNSGYLEFTDDYGTGVSILWKPASDIGSATSNLRYLVVRSSIGNIGTLAECDANGTPCGDYQAPTNMVNGYIRMDFTGLAPRTGYYYNVIVRDEDGDRAVYRQYPHRTCYGTNLIRVSGITYPFLANGYYEKNPDGGPFYQNTTGITTVYYLTNTIPPATGWSHWYLADNFLVAYFHANAVEAIVPPADPILEWKSYTNLGSGIHGTGSILISVVP